MALRSQKMLLLHFVALWWCPLVINAQTVSIAPSQTVPLPSATPTLATTEEDPIQRHLALIVGVPTGIGIAVVGLLLCGLWLVCSTYCENRQRGVEQSGTGAGGTATTNVKSKGGKSVPLRSVGSSGVDSTVNDPTRYEPEPSHRNSVQLPSEVVPDSTLQVDEPTHLEPIQEPTRFESDSDQGEDSTHDSTHQVDDPTQFESEGDSDPN